MRRVNSGRRVKTDSSVLGGRGREVINGGIFESLDTGLSHTLSYYSGRKMFTNGLIILLPYGCLRQPI